MASFVDAVGVDVDGVIVVEVSIPMTILQVPV